MVCHTESLVLQFSDQPPVVPKTAENFRALCTGEKGKGKQGKDLSFKGTPIEHRLVKNAEQRQDQYFTESSSHS